jgi:hypothetical protein
MRMNKQRFDNYKKRIKKRHSDLARSLHKFHGLGELVALKLRGFLTQHRRYKLGDIRSAGLIIALDF